MGFRIPLDGGEKRPGHERYYTEGYNAGYATAMDEMRKRTRGEMDGHYPPEDQGRPGSMEERYPPEDRKRTRSMDEYWSHEPQRIGFTSPPHERPDMLMEMVRDIKHGQDQIIRGMAESSEKLDPRLEAVLESAVKVMEHPPVTWEPYLQKKEYGDIVKMEWKELLAALEAKKPMRDIRKELTHTVAAVFAMVSAQ